MPKVVIELTANTAQAVTQIQAFAKAQKDTFDALRSANPVIADSTIQISKLVQSAQMGEHGMTNFNREARSLVHGGIADLLSQVPIVGGAMAKFAHELDGFPLLLGAMAGAGIGVIVFLENLQKEADRAVTSIGVMSNEIQAHFLAAVQRIRSIQAMAAGRPEEAAVHDFNEAVIRINAARDKAITESQQKQQAAIGWMEKAQRELNINIDGLNAQATIRQGEFDTERLKIMVQANDDILVAREDLKAKLIKAETDLNKELEKLYKESAQARIDTLTTALIFPTEKFQSSWVVPYSTALGEMTLLTDQWSAATTTSVAANVTSYTQLSSASTGVSGSVRELADAMLQQGNPALNEMGKSAEKTKAAIDALTSANSALIPVVESMGPKFKDIADQLKANAEIMVRVKAIGDIATEYQAGNLTLEQRDRLLKQNNADLQTLFETHKPLPPVIKATNTELEGTATAASHATTAVKELAGGLGAIQSEFTHTGEEIDHLAKGGGAVDQLGRGIRDLGQGFATTAGWSDDLRERMTNDIRMETGSINALTDAFKDAGQSAQQYGMAAGATFRQTTAEAKAAAAAADELADSMNKTRAAAAAAAAAQAPAPKTFGFDLSTVDAMLADAALHGINPTSYPIFGGVAGGGFAVNLLALQGQLVGSTQAAAASQARIAAMTAPPQAQIGVALQAGGYVGAPTSAMLAEHGPEIVLGRPSQQAFAAEFAGAIAQALGRDGGGALAVTLQVDGKTLAQVLIPELRRQARRGLT